MFLDNKRVYVSQQTPEISEENILLVNALSFELINYGYMLTAPLAEALMGSNDLETHVEAFLERFTVGELVSPLFPWENRRYMSLQDWREQVFSQSLGFANIGWYDPNYMPNLLANMQVDELRVISLATLKEVKEVCTYLANSTVNLSRQQMRMLIQGATHVGLGGINFNNNETRAVVMGAYASTVGLGVALKLFRCRPIDALRYAAMVNDPEQYNLPNEVMYASLPWQDRLGIMDFLNQSSFEYLSEAMGQNRNAWSRFIRAGRYLGQLRFRKDFPIVTLAMRVSLGQRFDHPTLRGAEARLAYELEDSGVIEVTKAGNMVYRTFASRIATAIENNDYHTTMSLLENRSGYFLRNLQTIMRVVRESQSRDFIKRVRIAMKNASANNLFSLIQINPKSAFRVIDANGLTTVQEASYPKVFYSVRRAAVAELQDRYRIDAQIVCESEIESLVPPFLSRNGELNRGDRIPIGDFNYIYTFVKWVEENRRTDLDKSLMWFSKDFNRSGYVNFGSTSNKFLSMSKDRTSAPAPEGATEYGQIRLIEAERAGAEWVAPVINVYSGDEFGKLSECYAGFQFSNNRKFGLQQDFTRYDLQSANAQANIPFVVNVRTREVLILDINLRESRGATVASYREVVQNMIKAMETRNTLTVADLAKILETPDSPNVVRFTENRSDNANSYGLEELGNLFSN